MNELLLREFMNRPFEVSIETLAMCNAACEFCTYPNLARIGTKMPDELINRLIDEMATWDAPFMFSPFKVNEPLLDVRLFDILEQFNERVPKGFVRLFTNGSALGTANIRKLPNIKNLEHVWVSLNSVDPVEYTKIMKLPWKRTADNLDALHDSFDGPVVLSRVAGTYNQNRDFVTYCNQAWPKFQAVVIKRDGWLGDIAAPVAQIPDTMCSRWFELSVTAAGIVSLCCMDGHAKFPIGDLNTQTMLEVYNDPAWRQRRETKMSRKQVFPCSTCSY